MAATIEGELTFAGMPALLRQADVWAAAGSVDVSRVTRVDSAGLAFLLELTRRARQRRLDFVICKPAPSLLSLATFFGLDGILRFKSSETPA